jgi:hypothetical protein
MAFSNTYDTTNPGSAVSNREDLTDVLSILAPQETPLLSLANKRKATAVYHEWTVDGLSAPDDSGVVEGADVSAFSDQFAARGRLGNYTQKFRRSYMVSDTQQAVDSVGPARYAQAEMKAVKEIKRDIEKALGSTNDRVAGGDGVASKLRGLGDWIDSAGPADVPANYRTPAGSIHGSGAFTESVLNNLITSIYRVNGSENGLTLVADTALRRVISDFGRLYTPVSTEVSIRKVNYQGGSAEIRVGVDLYKSDHGTVSIINMNPDCAPDTQNRDTGYLINPAYYGVAELVSLGSKALPDLGGGPRGLVDWQGTLEVFHPGAHGKITVLS